MSSWTWIIQELYKLDPLHSKPLGFLIDVVLRLNLVLNLSLSKLLLELWDVYNSKLSQERFHSSIDYPDIVKVLWYSMVISSRDECSEQDKSIPLSEEQ